MKSQVPWLRSHSSMWTRNPYIRSSSYLNEHARQEGFAAIVFVDQLQVNAHAVVAIFADGKGSVVVAVRRAGPEQAVVVEHAQQRPRPSKEHFFHFFHFWLHGFAFDLRRQHRKGVEYKIDKKEIRWQSGMQMFDNGNGNKVKGYLCMLKKIACVDGCSWSKTSESSRRCGRLPGRWTWRSAPRSTAAGSRGSGPSGIRHRRRHSLCYRSFSAAHTCEGSIKSWERIDRATSTSTKM